MARFGCLPVLSGRPPPACGGITAELRVELEQRGRLGNIAGPLRGVGAGKSDGSHQLSSRRRFGSSRSPRECCSYLTAAVPSTDTTETIVNEQRMRNSDHASRVKTGHSQLGAVRLGRNLSCHSQPRQARGSGGCPQPFAASPSFARFYRHTHARAMSDSQGARSQSVWGLKHGC